VSAARSAITRQTTPVQPEFAPIRVEPAYRKVAAALLERITARTINAGERLPAETELARQFGVHRGTVREALRELETNGVLKRERGSKLMMVTRPARVDVAAGVSRALALHDVSYHDIWEALTALEPPIAAAAARQRKPKDLARIETIVAAGVTVEQTAEGRNPHRSRAKADFDRDPRARRRAGAGMDGQTHPRLPPWV